MGTSGLGLRVDNKMEVTEVSEQGQAWSHGIRNGDELVGLEDLPKSDPRIVCKHLDTANLETKMHENKGMCMLYFNGFPDELKSKAEKDEEEDEEEEEEEEEDGADGAATVAEEEEEEEEEIV